MKKYIFYIFALISLASCVQHINIKDSNVLYDQYMKFTSLLSKRDYMPAIDMLSQRNLNDLSSHSNKKHFSQYFPVISTINNVLAIEQGSFSKLDNAKGCLTVFGLDSSNEPTSINIEYINEAGAWKLDYAQVMYHGSKTELPQDAKCPARM